MIDPELRSELIASVRSVLTGFWEVTPETRQLAKDLLTQKPGRRVTRRDWYDMKEIQALFKYYDELTVSQITRLNRIGANRARRLLSLMIDNGTIESRNETHPNGIQYQIYRRKDS